MAYLEGKEIHDAYIEATKEADVWREDYPEFERLMDNGIIEDLDDTLPLVNEGSLSQALYKLPKRVVPANLTGRAKALDSDDAWLTELANLQWTNNIVPNANSQAPFINKWKDAVRKAAGYGSQPIINLFVERGTYTGSDFIVPQVTDVKLEAGKVSDYDSDVIFWDVYYTKLQVKQMIEDAKEEMAEQETGGESYNKWDIETLEKVLNGNPEEDRPGNEEHSQKQGKAVKKNGIHFYIAFQRGVGAPFTMCHSNYPNDPIREWSNPDPTGDVPVHYLYCYQDFINPYGTGIVKLAGGTQNVLDYMRRADVLATQLGIRPPKMIMGNEDDVDFDSLTYTEDADWIVGNAKVERMEMANGVYSQLPQRIEMYMNSLNKVLPMGDTSVSAAAGDPLASKTPAGVKMQQANLSVDDEDFTDRLFECFQAVAKSMINTHFANMQGADPIKVTDDERELLAKAGIEFPVDEEGNPTNELVIEWEQARGTFDFEVDAEADKTKDEEKQLDGLMRIAEFISNPTTQQLIAMGGKMPMGTHQVDIGELVGTIVALSTDNDKIVTEMTPEEQDEQARMMEEQQMMQQGVDPATGQPMQPEAVEGEVMPEEGQEQEITPEEAQANVEAVMQQYGIDQNNAAAMLEAERQGFSPEEIQAALQERQAQQQPVPEELPL